MAQDRIIKIELGLTKLESGRPTTAILKLETGKGFRSGCRAHASVFWVGNGFETHALFSDFTKTVATLGGNATQANIDKLHGIAFNPQAVEIITGQAKAFYEQKTEQSEAA